MHTIENNKFLTELLGELFFDVSVFKFRYAFNVQGNDVLMFRWRWGVDNGDACIILTENGKVSEYSYIEIETIPAMIFVYNHPLVGDIFGKIADTIEYKYML